MSNVFWGPAKCVSIKQNTTIYACSSPNAIYACRYTQVLEHKFTYLLHTLKSVNKCRDFPERRPCILFTIQSAVRSLISMKSDCSQPNRYTDYKCHVAWLPAVFSPSFSPCLICNVYNSSANCKTSFIG